MYKVSKREVLFDTSGKSTCLATYTLVVVTVIIRHARKLVLSLLQCQKVISSEVDTLFKHEHNQAYFVKRHHAKSAYLVD